MDWSMILLPAMGEGVHEASIIKWLKKKSDPITEGEPLVEVATDKVDTEIVAEKSGFLITIYAQEGETVLVGDPIACIGKSAEIEAPKRSELQHSSTSKTQIQKSETKLFSHTESIRYSNSAPSTFSGILKITPLARNTAKRLGINELGKIVGTGQGGKITRRDIFSFYDSHSKTQETAGENIKDPADLLNEFKQKTVIKDGKEYLQGVAVRREKMSKIRKLTAEHMLRSVRTSPHVTTTFEMNLANLAAYKRELGSAFEKEHGTRLTYTAFFIAFAAQCLKEFPELNASVDGSDILFHEQVNIGCAVAVETELVVPVIRDTAKKSLLELANELDALTKAARSHKLSPSDIVGGTFTLTNPGMYGSVHSQPIINQPQVAILSIGTIVKKPWVEQKSENILVQPLCQIGLTFDHRIVDGRMGAMFLHHFEELALKPDILPTN